MKKINKKRFEWFRLLSHNFGAALATMGLSLLFESLIIKPNLLFNAFLRNIFTLYLVFYPILIGFVIVEDIIMLRRKQNGSKL